MFTDDVVQVKALIKNGVIFNEVVKDLSYAPLHFAAGAGKLLFSSIFYLT